MAKALRNYVSTPVPQSRPVSNLQVANNAGGFVFQVSDQSRLERFLILGTDGGTYYVGEVDLTTQNVDFLRKMIKEDPSTVLQTVLEISENGRAYRNSAAIFTLALVLTESDSAAIKYVVRNVVPRVARTATMVYELAEYIDKLGGWGPAKVKAIRSWFDSKTPEQLAFQAVKYRQRNGWTLRDLMRLSHPKNVDQYVGAYILGGNVSVEAPEILGAFKWMQNAKSVEDVLAVLKVHPNLPWETIPTQFLTEPRVWKKLFENGLSGQALLRNVTRFAKMNLFGDMIFAREFASRLTDENMIKKTRLHPMQYLNAYVLYTKGPARSLGYRVNRDKTWTQTGSIVDALDDGFGLSFGNIEPANKRTKISLDTSASMGWHLAGNTQLNCYEGSAAMSLITARTEPYYEVSGFSTYERNINISANSSINQAFSAVKSGSGGGTDCSQPMVQALEQGTEIDTFIVITDNETWYGGIHPHKALENYRQRMGIDARLVVMAMVPTQFSIANPLDRGMLDVVGFDANTPKVIADFSAGRL